MQFGQCANKNKCKNGSKPEEIIENCKKVIEIEPDNYEAYYEWGSCQRCSRDRVDAPDGKEQLTKVIEICTEIIKNDPENINALLYRADAGFKKAFEDYSKVIEIDPLNSRAYSGRAQMYDNSLEALKDFLKVIELDPQNINAYHNIGSIKYGCLEDYFGAIEAFTRIIEIDANNEYAFMNRGNVKVDYINVLGTRYDISGAIEDYSKTIEINPDNPYYYLSRGDAKKELHLYHEALEDFDIALKLGCSDDIYFYSCAKVKEQMNDFDGAVHDYKKAIQKEIEINPKALFYHFALCRFYCKRKEYDKAKEVYLTGMALHPIYTAEDYPTQWLEYEGLGDLIKYL